MHSNKKLFSKAAQILRRFGYSVQIEEVSANAPIQKGTAGAKPLEFALWIFRCLGARPVDHFSDVFHGSGAVTDAWTFYCRQIDFTRGNEE